MPKEITHFFLAHALGRAVPEASIFYAPIQKFPFLFCLGSVTPDIPFYYLAGPIADKVHALGLPFHGTDHQSLGPVMDFLERHQSGPALALAAGVICHILSDTQFHPLVYYYAGMDGIHGGATARHRQFETAMDLYFWSLYPGETSLSRVVKKSELSRSHLCRYLVDLFHPAPLVEKVVDRSLAWHTSVQTLFRSSVLRRGMVWFNRMGRPLPERVTGLFYPCDRPVCLPFFSREIRYRDPCTGKGVTTRIKNMIQGTVQSGLQVLDLVTMTLAGNRPLNQVMKDPDLPLVRPRLPRKIFNFWRGKTDLNATLYQGRNIQYLF